MVAHSMFYFPKQDDLNPIIKYFLFIILILFISNIDLFANPIIKSKPIPSPRFPDSYEIGLIQFTGNNFISSNQLMNFIQTKETKRSFPHKVLQAYLNEGKKNKAAPRVLLREINTAIKSLEHEISLFNEKLVEYDTFALHQFYNIHGYHDVRVRYIFLPDYAKRRNVLTFAISEGERYKIDTIVYLGLGDIAPDVSQKIEQALKYLPQLFYFEENLLNQQITTIYNILLNNGYYYATYQKPVVSIYTAKKSDSITVVFNLGKRVTFGKIVFIDSTRGQHIVTHEMKRKQLEFNSGDWYSRQKLNASVENLLTLGTFDVVEIDTCSNSGNQDTVLNFCLRTSYRKQREWSFALFTNRTPLTNFNAGVEGNISHRNLFGMAQSGSLLTSFSFKDIGKTLQNFNNLDYEMLLGARFYQPLLWIVDNTRVAASASLSYSIRKVYNLFQINTLQLPIRFSLNLPKKTFFNTVSLDFSFERENPVNFPTAVAEASRRTTNPDDSLRVIESFFLYNNLYQYLNEPDFHLWTSNTMGLNLISDKKNDPFNPTKGSYTTINLDGWNVFLSHPSISGIARYFRVHLLHSQYIQISSNLILAAKLRAGAIKLMQEANVYVPIERQFFAGGSNSVRGWTSRTLRYTKITSATFGSYRTYEYMQNFIGNAGIFEGSLEFRYRLRYYRWINELIAEHISNITFTSFLDFGNSFDWFIGVQDYKLKFTDYITKLAVSAGFGVGYISPVGPIRLDVATPLFDPTGRRKAFSRTVYHFGIGYAF